MTKRNVFSPYRQQAVAWVIGLAAGASLCFTLLQGAYAADDLNPVLKGLSRDEILRMGEVMYLSGRLPSGETMKAVVKGDVPVDGAMFTCVSCHQRSGFGSTEGTVRTSPIDGTRLYSPLSKFKGMPVQSQPGAQLKNEDLYRAAYTDDTLARSIQTGEDSSGRPINDVMPKYLLNDRDAHILTFYLKNLSTGLQSGVTETNLHFATIVTDDVSKEDREAMVSSLRSFVSTWRISKNMDRMNKAGAYLAEGTVRGPRTMSLSVWELKGPAETWRGQLEDYYKKAPVFAFLGGISTGDWAPIHRFCEDRRVPAFFPLTDLPVISDTDWYTLYLSKGLYQEGETAARYLHGRSDLLKDRSIVQVFRKDRAGIALSKAFQETWSSLGHGAPDNIVLDQTATISIDRWKTLARKHKHAVVLIWLDAKDFPALDTLTKAQARPETVFASYSLLKQSLYALPENERASVYVTYPYTLPQDAQKFRSTSEPRSRNMALSPTIQDVGLKMRALFSTLTGPLARIRNYVYRDYFIELIESTPDQSMAAGIYPRLSFGSGQRYAAKGCYIVQLTAGPAPGLIAKSEWVIH